MRKQEFVLCVQLDGKEEKALKSQAALYKEVSELAAFQNATDGEKMKILHELCDFPENAYETVKSHDGLQDVRSLFDGAVVDGSVQSGKLELLAKMCRSLIEHVKDEKAIIICRSNNQMDMLAKYLKDKEIDCAQFREVDDDDDSDEKEDEQQMLLCSFAKEPTPRLLLLHAQAGNSYINLSRANHVFMMSPNFYPADDHRTVSFVLKQGQSRTVNVYRFVSTGTIEEVRFANQVLTLQQDKLPFLEEFDYLNITWGRDLFFRYATTSSSTKDVLDEYSKELWLRTTEYASDLILSKQYCKVEDVPDGLPLAMEAFKTGRVTYAFHIETDYEPIPRND